MKKNAKLHELTENKNHALYRAARFDQIDHAIELTNSCIEPVHGVIRLHCGIVRMENFMK